MSAFTESLDIDVPIRTAYDQWTQFEEFPKFMDGVEAVDQIDDTHLAWKAKIGGVEKRWEAEITDQTPDRRIAWRAIDGARNEGAVTFEPLGDDRTRLTLHLDVEPEGPIESTGDALGFVERRAKGDMERFKTFIEARRSETGAWRGSVDDSIAR